MIKPLAQLMDPFGLLMVGTVTARWHMMFFLGLFSIGFEFEAQSESDLPEKFTPFLCSSRPIVKKLAQAMGIKKCCQASDSY